MAFDPATYVPGDAWTSADFLTRALTGPRIRVDAETAGDATDGSYFELRSELKDRIIEVSVACNVGEPSFVVHLQRSFDDGATWETVKAFTDTVAQEAIEYTSFYKLRLLYVSGTSPVTLRLWQDL